MKRCMRWKLHARWESGEKTELIYHEEFKTKEQANEMIFEYIEIFYNRQRHHSYNDYIPPVEFEEKRLHKKLLLRI